MTKIFCDNKPDVIIFSVLFISEYYKSFTPSIDTTYREPSEHYQRSDLQFNVPPSVH